MYLKCVKVNVILSLMYLNIRYCASCLVLLLIYVFKCSISK